MFPFLAPFSYQLRGYRQTIGQPFDFDVFVAFPVEREPPEGGSSTSSAGSRPTSRSSLVSKPSSARSTPLPVPVEVPTNVLKQRQKGLETSQAMKDLFGGGGGYSWSEKAVPEKVDTSNTNRFGRKNIFEKERIQTFADVIAQQSQTAIFSSVPDHDRIYEKCSKRVRKKLSPEEEKDAPGADTFPADEDEEVVADEGPSRKESREQTPPILDVPGPDITSDEEQVLVHEETEEDNTEDPYSRLSNESEGGGESADGESAARDAEGVSTASGGGGDMAASMLIRSAQIVNDDSVFVADVLVQNGVITQVAPSIEAPAGIPIVEAEGRILMPAGIDVHTHFSAPQTADDIARGSKAAVAGGTATVVETARPTDNESLVDAIKRVKKAAESDSVCNVAVSGVITRWNDSVRSQLEAAAKEEAVNSFIVDVDEQEHLYQILETCRSIGAHVRVLPENKNIVRLLEEKMLELGITGPEGYLQSRPEELEGERVSNVCVLSKLTNCPVSILQLSSAEAARSLQHGRESSSLVHGEVAAAALATDGSHYFNRCLKHAASHMTDAPLRPDQTAASTLIHLLGSSPLSVITSGHRAYASSARSGSDFTKMPRGVAACEERMAVLWEKAVRSGRIDPMRFVALTSTNAAKIFNLYPKKGRIAVGADADLVVWESGAKRPLGKGQSASDLSVFDGINVHSNVSMTIVGGRIAWSDGNVEKGRGVVVPTPTHSPYLFGCVQQREKNAYEKVERGGSQPERTENGTSTADKHKHKNLQSSIQFGDSAPPRTTGVRRNPPGGRSTGLW